MKIVSVATNGIKRCEDFTVMSLTITNSVISSVECCTFDTSLAGCWLSMWASKLPAIKGKQDRTLLQVEFKAITRYIAEADEIVCGLYKRDVTLLEDMYKKYIRQDGVNIFPERSAVKELLYDIPRQSNIVNLNMLLEYFSVSIDDARSVACSILEEDYYQDLSNSAVKASIYLMSKLSDMGYASYTVADAICNYNDAYLGGDREIAVAVERVF